MEKRSNYLPWEDYFMSVAFLSGMRSKDPSTQVGACIINKNNIILAIGYNGMPRGCNDDELPWGKESKNCLETKYMYVCHAEMNAVLNKNSADVVGATIYTLLFPCNECAKIIIQSQIKEVVYYSDKNKDKIQAIASTKLLDMAGVHVRQLIPEYLRINIKFSLKNLNEVLISELCLENIQLSEENKTSLSNKKRLDYLSWEEYFMALAFLSSHRSKDPLTQRGACIVNDDMRIVGIGYNGMPQGCSDEILPWDVYHENPLSCKDLYECHAEMNAILNKNCGRIAGCRMYVSAFPCNECAKFIIQERIRGVVFFSDPNPSSVTTIAAKKMLDMAGVEHRKYNGSREIITVKFGKP